MFRLVKFFYLDGIEHETELAEGDLDALTAIIAESQTHTEEEMANLADGNNIRGEECFVRYELYPTD